MTVWITTNGRPSNGAATLAKQEGFARLRKGGKVKPNDIVVNWGASGVLNGVFMNGQKAVLNVPWAVQSAVNKITTFEKLDPEDAVEWTTSKEEASVWLKKYHVVARTTLTGHSGAGIIIVEPGQELPDAPLYTRYVFKEKEFRVHVVRGHIIDTVRKIKDPKITEPKCWKVRSHANGFIFARNGLEPDPERNAIAARAIKALLLDFGAVDLIQDKHGKYYVLEVNTAPGLEGETSVNAYAQAFRNVEWAVNDAGTV